MGFFNGQFSGMRTIVTFVIISTLLSFLYFPAQASQYQAPPLPRQGEAVDLSVASSTDSFTSSLEPLFSGCGGASVNAFNSQYEQQVVELVNAGYPVDELTRGLVDRQGAYEYIVKLSLARFFWEEPTAS